MRTEGIPGAQIDPLEDNYIEYEEMKYWPDLVFNVPIDLGSGRYSPVKVDYYNDLPVGNLKIIVEKIRSETEEKGSLYFALFRYYDYFFCQASLAPKSLSHWNVDSTEKTLNYLKRWSVHSIYNFELYQEFMKELDISRENIYYYYIEKHEMNCTEAQRVTNIVLSKIIDRAAGSYPSDTYCYQPDVISPLLASIYNNDTLKIVKVLLQQENDYWKKLEALRASILLDRSPLIIEAIAKSIGDINQKPPGILSCQESPLSCGVKDYQKVELLLTLGADPNHENDFGKTPLYYGIEYGGLEVVKLLVESGADVNHKYKKSKDLPLESLIIHGMRTPLMHAAQHSNVDVLKYLLKKGADLKEIDEVGDNALDYAIRGNKLQNIRFLKSKGLKSNQE